MVVAVIGSDKPHKMVPAEDDNVLEQLAPAAANPAFSHGILPRTTITGVREDLLTTCNLSDQYWPMAYLVSLAMSSAEQRLFTWSGMTGSNGSARVYCTAP